MTKGPIAFEFRSSRVTKVLALIQKLQQKLVTVQLCPMLRCLRTNNSTQSLRIFGLGSNTPRKLENFISLSDQVVRQCVASNFGENSTPDISSHFTANEDRSIVACLSVFFCDEELGSADGERNIHCCFSVYSPNLDRLALFEEQLGYLNRYERLIYQAFDVKFNGNSNLVAIGVNLISSFGIDEQRTRFELNCPLDITEAQASGLGRKRGLLHRLEDSCAIISGGKRCFELQNYRKSVRPRLPPPSMLQIPAYIVRSACNGHSVLSGKAVHVYC